MNIVIYDNITKNSIRWANVPDNEHADIQCGYQESWIEGAYVYGCYVEDDVLKYRPTQPNEYSVFNEDTKEWDTDLNVLKLGFIQKLKQAAQDLIFSNISQIAQINLLSRVAELEAILTAKILVVDEVGYPCLDVTTGLYLMHNGREWTAEEQHEWTLLQLKRNWIRKIRTASNVAEVSINNATKIEAITTIFNEAYNSIGELPTI